MTQGLDNYRNATKENWRGWAWNQIRDRLTARGKSVCTARGLYLVGPDDLDRKAALSKGFSGQNLFAVDMVEHNVVKVRKNRGIAIQEDVFGVLANWGESLDFIMLDLCSGVTHQLLEFICRASSYSLDSPICVFNVMRGRDSAKVLGAISKTRPLHHQYCRGRRRFEPTCNPPDTPHRGVMLAGAIEFCAAHQYIEEHNLPVTDQIELPPKNPSPAARREYGLRLSSLAKEFSGLRTVREALAPSYYSYLSKPACAVYFDSVATFMPNDCPYEYLALVDLYDLIFNTSQANGEPLTRWCEVTRMASQPQQKIKRKVAAAKAVSTMRQCI